MDRAHSLPPLVNPFWSDRVVGEARLREARPAELPPVPQEDGDLDSPRGRGRTSRSRSSGVGRKEAVRDRASTSRVRTPPNSWLTPPVAQSAGGDGGPVKGRDGKGGRRHGEESLQQALERSVVERLAEENQRLREELAKTRPRGVPDSDSNRSWSEVDGSGKGRRSEGRMPMSAEPEKTEGEFELEEVKAVTFTPGGTQVPSGPPPEEELLPVPPPPSWMMAEWDIYQKEEMRRGGLMGDRQWAPRCQRMGLPSPEQARMMWLERELQALQGAVRDSGSGRGLSEPYWAQPVHRWPVESRPEDGWWWKSGARNYGPKECQDGRASAAGLNECHDDRAVAFGPGEYQRDRALASGQGEYQRDRASASGQGEFQRDRALASGSGELLRDRALAFGPEEPQCDRALAFGPGEVRSDRAVAFGLGELQGDRASATGLGRDRNELTSVVGRGGGSGDQVGIDGEGNAGRMSTKGVSLEDGYEDQLRSFPIKLPQLPDPAMKLASLEAGDWLTQVRPLIGDVSARAGSWWDGVLQSVTSVYTCWLEASPLERLKIVAPRVDQCGRHSERLSQRVTTMLLEALPQGIRSELIATRKLEVNEILFHIHKVYQPGGVAERQQMLSSITSTREAVEASQAVEDLRLWKRQVLRCKELKLALPDGLLRIQALDKIMKGLLRRDAQASFRISTFRLQQKIDIRPEEETLENFFDLLLAEAEYMMMGQTKEEGSGQSGKPPGIKSINVTPQHGKGERAGGVVCKWWGSDKGCKNGRGCKFSHDMNLTDKAERCWLCSSKEHRKATCPTKNGEMLNGGSREVEGDGKGHGKNGKSGGKGKNKDDQKESPGNPTAAAISAGEGNGAASGDAGNEVGREENKQKNEKSPGEDLMTEVSSLLKSIRMQGTYGAVEPQVRAYFVRSVTGGEDGVRTLLDGGATHCLRQAKSQQEWSEATTVKVQLASEEVEMKLHPLFNTLLVQHKVQPIVPLCKLTAVGWLISWESSGCIISHPEHGFLPLELHQGCPMVDEGWGEKLMKMVEGHEMERFSARAVLLGERQPTTTMERDLQQLKQLFPQVPVLERIPGEYDVQTDKLPFNRHKRRQLRLAKTVVINLFSGEDLSVWKKYEKPGVEFLHLDILKGGDLLRNQHLAGWLQEVAREGRCSLWLAGPPCRSVSWCRYRQQDGKHDGGPPPLRSRHGSERFGLGGLSSKQALQTDDDSVMFLRTLWWFSLSGASGQSAEHLIEQPRDPEEWADVSQAVPTGAPSFMIWPETQAVMEQLNLSMVRVDQGSLGHATRKPTMLATDVREVKWLNGRQCDQGSQQDVWTGDVAQRIETSRSLAQWAPGLCRTIGLAVERRALEPAVKSLTPKEKKEIQSWQEHYRCGHLPYRGDCPTCLVSAGRDKPHPVRPCPTSYCLSLDVMGPFKEGVDQSIKGAKYAMIGVYTIPIDGEGTPLPEGLSALSKGRCGLDDLDEGEEVIQDSHHNSHPSQEQEAEDVFEEQEEVDEQELSEFEVKQQELNEKRWKEFLQERKAMPVRNVTFGVPLKDRSIKAILTATATIYARVRAMRLPVTRIHTDRAKEFGSGGFQQWCLGRDLHHTMTAGDDPMSNARCERELGWIKARTRTLMLATEAPRQFWPLAIRQACEERLRGQLDRVGVVTPVLLPFGTRVVVKKKAWHHREDDSGWKWPMKKATVWGPAADMSVSSGAYYIRDEEGRFFRSTVVRQVGISGKTEEGLKQGELGTLRSEPTGEIPCQLDRWCIDPGSGVDRGDPATLDGKVETREEENPLESVVMDILGDEVQEVRRHDQPRRRMKGKTPPIQKETTAPVVLKICKDGTEGWTKDDEAIEQLALMQHVSLNQYAKELIACCESGEVSEDVVHQLASVKKEVGELEQVLHGYAVRQLEVTNQEVCPPVSQTRLVGMDEVRRSIDEWKKPFEDEVTKLMDGALERITDDQFRALLKEDKEVECLPMKAVATVKAGGKQKARIVVCGNFSEKLDDDLDIAAGGVDSVTIRTAISTMVHRSWVAASTDVASAFLQAPRRTNSKRVTICDPPSVLKKMGLVAEGERWRVHQALYGLQQSPSDWGCHRDAKLAQLQWLSGEDQCSLVETPEKHVWRIVGNGHQDQELGFLLVYVDDLLFVGLERVVSSAIQAVRSLWQCAEPEYLNEEKAMRFCGFELRREGDGVILNQEGYTKSLLAKHDVVGTELTPLPKLTEEDEPEQFELSDLRRAQGVVGELLWLATRTRPDLCYTVGALGRLLHKRPKYVNWLAGHVLKYVNKTAESGLWYRPCQKGDLGTSDHLGYPRTLERLDVYSDISYAPAHEGYRSIQGIAVEHAGCLLAWESGRQAIVSLSTCGAELISFSEAHQVGNAVGELVQVFGFKATRLLHGDSKAAISASTSEGGSWRTRHLRLRAFALRQALKSDDGHWKIHHLRGEHLLADGLTKVLMGQSFSRFCEKLRMFQVKKPSSQKLQCRKMRFHPKIVAVGSLLAVMAKCNLVGPMYSVLLGVAAAALLVWTENQNDKRARGLRPEGRPQQDPKKDQEGDTTCSGYDRSGTVTNETGSGKPSGDNPPFGEISRRSTVQARVCALRAGDQEGHRAPHGAEQLPIRPTRAPGQSTASARGEAAGRTAVVVGRKRGVASSSRSEVDPGAGTSEQGQSTGGAVYTVEEAVMSQTPVTMLISQACPLTRVVQSGDKPNVVAVWDYAMFHQVPKGEDRWFTTWDHLLIRIHGRPRTRAFHPLHRSTPYPLTKILPKRCTILFPTVGQQRQVKIDTWNSNLPFFEGQWKGYTIFDLAGATEVVEVQKEPSESDGSYEVVVEE